MTRTRDLMALPAPVLRELLEQVVEALVKSPRGAHLHRVEPDQ